MSNPNSETYDLTFDGETIEVALVHSPSGAAIYVGPGGPAYIYVGTVRKVGIGWACFHNADRFLRPGAPRHNDYANARQAAYPMIMGWCRGR